MKKVFLFVFSFLNALIICADTYVWTGDVSGENKWSTPANWDPNAPEEGFNQDDICVIGGETSQAINLDIDANIQQIQVDNANTTLNLGGKRMEFSSEVANPIQLGGGNFVGPLNVVISNGTIRTLTTTKKEQLFFHDGAKNSFSTLLFDNVVFTNDNVVSFESESTNIIRNSKWYLSSVDINTFLYIGNKKTSGTEVVFEGPQTEALMNTKGGSVCLCENATLVVSNKASVVVSAGILDFNKSGCTIIVDDGSYTQGGSGFQFNVGGKLIVKNNGSFTCNMLIPNKKSTGTHDTTNFIIRVENGGSFLMEGYHVPFNGIDGYGGYKFIVDGEESQMSFKHNKTERYITFACSNNLIEVKNQGLFNLPRYNKATNQIFNLKSMNNCLKLDNGRMNIGYSYASIGDEGTNNVLSLANASTIDISQKCSFVIGRGDYSTGNELQIFGEGNKINLTDDSNFCASNSSVVAFVLTENMTGDEPMLEFASTSSGRIVLDGFTAAKIDDTSLREAGEKIEVALLKIPTEKFDGASLTSILEAAAGDYGKINRVVDETHTYFMYKMVDPGLTLLIR